MTLTLSIEVPMVKVEIESSQSFTFDVSKVVELTAFVQAMSDFRETVTILPADLAVLTTARPEDLENSREARMLLEYIVRIIEAFNLSFEEVMIEKPQTPS